MLRIWHALALVGVVGVAATVIVGDGDRPGLIGQVTPGAADHAEQATTEPSRPDAAELARQRSDSFADWMADEPSVETGPAPTAPAAPTVASGREPENQDDYAPTIADYSPPPAQGSSERGRNVAPRQDADTSEQRLGRDLARALANH